MLIHLAGTHRWRQAAVARAWRVTRTGACQEPFSVTKNSPGQQRRRASTKRCGLARWPPLVSMTSTPARAASASRASSFSAHSSSPVRRPPSERALRQATSPERSTPTTPTSSSLPADRSSWMQHTPLRLPTAHSSPPTTSSSSPRFGPEPPRRHVVAFSSLSAGASSRNRRPSGSRTVITWVPQWEAVNCRTSSTGASGWHASASVTPR
jgi:hypothetical protein